MSWEQIPNEWQARSALIRRPNAATTVQVATAIGRRRRTQEPTELIRCRQYSTTYDIPDPSDAHKEGIKVPAWKQYNSAESLPDAPGVYAVYLHGVLVYIGSSKHVRKRLYQHRQTADWHLMDGVSFKARVVALPGDWLRREYRLLLRLRPGKCRIVDHRCSFSKKTIKNHRVPKYIRGRNENGGKTWIRTSPW